MGCDVGGGGLTAGSSELTGFIVLGAGAAFSDEAGCTAMANWLNTSENNIVIRTHSKVVDNQRLVFIAFSINH